LKLISLHGRIFYAASVGLQGKYVIKNIQLQLVYLKERKKGARGGGNIWCIICISKGERTG